MLIDSTITKIDFLKYDADCYFLNNPWQSEIEAFNFIMKITKLLSKKNIIATLSLIGDSGELYNNNKMIMIGIEWYYSKATN